MADLPADLLVRLAVDALADEDIFDAVGFLVGVVTFDWVFGDAFDTVVFGADFEGDVFFAAVWATADSAPNAKPTIVK